MKISILVDDPDAWILPYANKLSALISGSSFECRKPVFSANELDTGDICFLLGCTRLMPAAILDRHKLNLVVHESALPKGRGWSPVQWQILEGRNEIPVSIFEATAEADAGPVWLRDILILDGTELLPEIRQKQGEKTVEMVLRFLKEHKALKPTPQLGEASTYRRRGELDDQLDPNISIAEQFDRLRIADNSRYPTRLVHRGKRYILKIERG